MMDSRAKALGHLRQSLRAGRGEDLPAQKVSVMADSKKGLEDGLDKAKDLLSGGMGDILSKVAPVAKGEMDSKMKKPEDMQDESDMSPEEQSESPSEEKSEDYFINMSDDDISAMQPEELKQMCMKMRDLMKADEQE